MPQGKSAKESTSLVPGEKWNEVAKGEGSERRIGVVPNELGKRGKTEIGPTKKVKEGAVFRPKTKTIGKCQTGRQMERRERT